MKKCKLHYSWIIVTMCCLVLMQGSLTSAAVAQNLAVLRESRGFTGKETSFVSVCITLASLFLSMPLFQKVIKRFGIRKPILIALIVEGAVFMLWGFCGSNLILLYLGAVINGLILPYTGAMLIPTILINRWFNKNRGLALGLACAGTGISSFVWAPVIQRIYSTVNDSSVFITEAIAMVVVAVLQYVFIRETPEEMGLEPLGGNDFAVEKKAASLSNNYGDLSRTGFFLLILSTIFVGYTAGACSQNMALNFRYDGFDPAIVAKAVSLYGILLVFTKLYMGRYKDKHGMFKTSVLFLIIQSAGVFLFAGARWIKTPSIMFISTIIYSLGAPMQMMSAPSWAADFSAPESTLKYVEKTHMGYLGGQVVGALLTGVIADSTGYYTVAYFTYAIALLLACMIVSILYVNRGKRKSMAMSREQ